MLMYEHVLVLSKTKNINTVTKEKHMYFVISYLENGANIIELDIRKLPIFDRLKLNKWLNVLSGVNFLLWTTFTSFQIKTSEINNPNNY
ncbi:hypothetical protein NQ317_017781 [Molorchus minor]|uniref:Uncharacterized protein n=1 Tax=Molorchus minor TaxID=1323400 RepID=A0ABQ9K220_9CUCU|nr:hypothetical protein NQ317_017781 [Molorchus minor]